MTPIAAHPDVRRCVLDVPKKKFEHIFDGVKAAKKIKFDYDLKPERAAKKSSLNTRS